MDWPKYWIVQVVSALGGICGILGLLALLALWDSPWRLASLAVLPDASHIEVRLHRDRAFCPDQPLSEPEA